MNPLTLLPKVKTVKEILDQAVRHRTGIRNLGEIMNEGRLAEQNALNRRLVRKTQDGTLGKETPDTEDEDMASYNVGDVYNIPQPPPPPKSSGMGTIAAALLGAAIPAAAIAGYAYSTLPKEKPASPTDKDSVTPSVPSPGTTGFKDTDTDTRYSIRFGEE